MFATVQKLAKKLPKDWLTENMESQKATSIQLSVFVGLIRRLVDSMDKKSAQFM